MIKMIAGLLIAAILFTVADSFLTSGDGIAATSLTVNMNTTAVTANVTDTTGFLNTGVLWIGGEKCYYAGTTAAAFTGLTRAYEGTEAKMHVIGDQVYTETTGALNKAIGFDVGALAATSGWTAVVMIPFDFCRYTLPKVITWDYDFLDGDLMMIVRIALMVISAAITIGFAIQLGSMIQNILKR